MSSQDLPFDVLIFLQRRIAGIEDLEALLLVRSDSARGWTAAALASALDRPESWAGPALERLCAAELFVSRDGDTKERRFSYQPAPALEAMVNRLVQLYDEQRADILRALNHNAVDRIRAAVAKTFSGAFDGGKKKTRKRDGKLRSGKRRSGGREGGPSTEGV